MGLIAIRNTLVLSNLLGYGDAFQGTAEFNKDTKLSILRELKLARDTRIFQWRAFVYKVRVHEV
jgi:hypothetical protein